MLCAMGIIRSADNLAREPLSATIALPISRQQAAALAALSDDDLMAAVTGAPLPRLIEQAPKHDPLLD